MLDFIVVVTTILLVVTILSIMVFRALSEDESIGSVYSTLPDSLEYGKTIYVEGIPIMAIDGGYVVSIRKSFNWWNLKSFTHTHCIELYGVDYYYPKFKTIKGAAHYILKHSKII